MGNAKTKRVRKPYTPPVLVVHGDVREVTRSVNGSGTLDGKAKGNKEFKTA
jgi:hypothetical protein